MVFFGFCPEVCILDPCPCVEGKCPLGEQNQGNVAPAQQSNEESKPCQTTTLGVAGTTAVTEVQINTHNSQNCFHTKSECLKIPLKSGGNLNLAVQRCFAPDVSFRL